MNKARHSASASDNLLTMNQIDQWLAQSADWVPYVLPAIGFLLGIVLTWVILSLNNKAHLARLEEKLHAALEGTDEARKRLAISQREIDTYRANENRLIRLQGDLEGQLRMERQRLEGNSSLAAASPALSQSSELVVNQLTMPEKEAEVVKQVFEDRAAQLEKPQVIQPKPSLPETNAGETPKPEKVEKAPIPMAVAPAVEKKAAPPIPPQPAAKLTQESVPQKPVLKKPELPKPAEKLEGFLPAETKESQEPAKTNSPDPRGAADELRRALKNKS